jgi:ribosome-binding factor A
MLRGMVGRNCHLRYAPELRFEEDHSLERGARIEEILRKLPHPDDDGGTGGGEEKG